MEGGFYVYHARHGRAGWLNPSIITISLIVINCLIYFLFQYDDGERHGEAFWHYMESGIEKIELTAYIDFRSAGRLQAGMKISMRQGFPVVY